MHVWPWNWIEEGPAFISSAIHVRGRGGGGVVFFLIPLIDPYNGRPITRLPWDTVASPRGGLGGHVPPHLRSVPPRVPSQMRFMVLRKNLGYRYFNPMNKLWLKMKINIMYYLRRLLFQLIILYDSVRGLTPVSRPKWSKSEVVFVTLKYTFSRLEFCVESESEKKNTRYATVFLIWMYLYILCCSCIGNMSVITKCVQNATCCVKKTFSKKICYLTLNFYHRHVENCYGHNWLIFQACGIFIFFSYELNRRQKCPILAEKSASETCKKNFF